MDLRASAAISDAPSAFPKFAIFGSDADLIPANSRGDSRFSKAVASFQRQVKGMATTAPAAARKCATGSPSMPATRPHTALPTVIAPKKTIKNIAEFTRAHPIRQGDLGGRIKARDDKRPRSSRNEACAESDLGSRASPNRTSPNAAMSEANATRPSGPSLAFSQFRANEPPMAPAPIMLSRVP